MSETLQRCHQCGLTVSSEALACPYCGAEQPKGRSASRRRRGCLIVVAVLFVASLARNGGQQRSTSHHIGARHTVPAGAVVCESLPELNRMVDLLGDATDDYIAARKFMLVSTCHQVQQPTLVIVEDHEGFDFVRVRAPGAITSWYMLDNRLE